MSNLYQISHSQDNGIYRSYLQEASSKTQGKIFSQLSTDKKTPAFSFLASSSGGGAKVMQPNSKSQHHREITFEPLDFKKEEERTLRKSIVFNSYRIVQEESTKISSSSLRQRELVFTPTEEEKLAIISFMKLGNISKESVLSSQIQQTKHDIEEEKTDHLNISSRELSRSRGLSRFDADESEGIKIYMDEDESRTSHHKISWCKISDRNIKFIPHPVYDEASLPQSNEMETDANTQVSSDSELSPCCTNAADDPSDNKQFISSEYKVLKAIIIDQNNIDDIKYFNVNNEKTFMADQKTNIEADDDFTRKEEDNSVESGADFGEISSTQNIESARNIPKALDLMDPVTFDVTTLCSATSSDSDIFTIHTNIDDEAFGGELWTCMHDQKKATGYNDDDRLQTKYSKYRTLQAPLARKKPQGFTQRSFLEEDETEKMQINLQALYDRRREKF